jgi:hypothetical protein
MQTLLQYPNLYIPRQYTIKPGTILSVPALYGTVRHYGLSSDLGYVIDKSFKLGSVAERPMDEFLDGKDLRLEGYWGALDPSYVIQNARRRIGEQWTIGQNCEHFVRECHGLKSESPQLFRAVSGVLVGAALLRARP